MTAPFRPNETLEVLRRHKVDFIVIGGYSASVQGSPMLTQDVDVVPANDAENWARMSAALVELEAHVRGGDDAFTFDHDGASLAASRIWNLTTKFGDLDITQTPSGTQGFDDLRAEALTVQIRGQSVMFASLADIIRSKEAAGRDKDRRALPILRELLDRQIRERVGRPPPGR